MNNETLFFDADGNSVEPPEPVVVEVLGDEAEAMERRVKTLQAELDALNGALADSRAAIKEAERFEAETVEIYERNFPYRAQ